MSLRHALLGLLAEAPMSGYDLLKRFEHSLSSVWPARHNQIYSELKYLLEHGLIEQGDQGARGRKEYVITELGLREVRRWMREEDEPVDHSLRFEPLLRANFLWLLNPEERKVYLVQEEEYYRRQYTWLEQQMATLPDETDGPLVARRIAATAGLRFFEAMAEWASTTYQSLNGDQGKEQG